MVYIDAKGNLWPCIVFMGKDEFLRSHLYCPAEEEAAHQASSWDFDPASPLLPPAYYAEPSLNLPVKGLKSIVYAGEGEPLLHKEAFDIINYTKALGIDAAVSTNGVLLTAEASREVGFGDAGKTA